MAVLSPPGHTHAFGRVCVSLFSVQNFNNYPKIIFLFCQPTMIVRGFAEIRIANNYQQLFYSWLMISIARTNANMYTFWSVLQIFRQKNVKKKLMSRLCLGYVSVMSRFCLGYVSVMARFRKGCTSCALSTVSGDIFYFFLKILKGRHPNGSHAIRGEIIEACSLRVYTMQVPTTLFLFFFLSTFSFSF